MLEHSGVVATLVPGTSTVLESDFFSILPWEKDCICKGVKFKHCNSIQTVVLHLVSPFPATIVKHAISTRLYLAYINPDKAPNI